MDITGIGSVLDFGGKIIDKLWPDPAKADAAKLELFKLQQQGEFKQMDQVFELAKSQVTVNTEEAKSTNWFVAGARPFIMWGCGFAMLYAAVFEPLCRFIASVFFGYSGQFPVIDTNITMQVLLGILGLSGMRTTEKLKNAEGNR
jgi:hypothetical protein